MKAHPECYAATFPDFTRLKRTQRLEGRAFAALVMSSGTGAHGRNLEVKGEAWEKYVACADYGTCYNLSLAKLDINDVLMNTMVASPWVGERTDEQLL